MILDSIRARITAWYAVVLTVVLIAAGMGSYFVTRQQIRRSTDASVATTVRQLTAGLNGEAEEEPRGALSLRPADELLREFRDKERAILLLRPDGSVFAAHDTPLARDVDRDLLRRKVAARAFGYETLDGVRLFLTPVRIGSEPFVVAVAQSLAGEDETSANLRNAMLVTIPVALLVASLGGYLLARKSLEPVVRMSSKARAIGAANLSERIEGVNPRDELGELAGTLNDLLSRLEQSFASQRRFMADASHELRSPVAILQGELDVTLSRDDRNAADYRESLEVMRRSVGRLTRIVRDLFLLARGDAGEMSVKRSSFYLGDVVAQTVRAFRTVAAERKVALRASCDDNVVVEGDEDLIQRMIGNLIDNAIKYTQAGTEVAIRCSAVGDEARVEVHDRGVGIPPHLWDRVFERFYRVDSARGTALSAEGSGAGLGLPIARWIAEAHGGSVTLAKSDGSGSVFAAMLPRRHAEAISSGV